MQFDSVEISARVKLLFIVILLDIYLRTCIYLNKPFRRSASWKFDAGMLNMLRLIRVGS